MSQKIRRMPRGERRRLLREGRKSGDAATCERFLIVAMLGGERQVVEVARLLGVAIAHVSRTQARFLRDGVEGLYDRRRNNGTRKVTTEFLFALALDVRSGRLHIVGDYSKSSRLFGQLLFRLAARYRRARVEQWSWVATW